MIDKQLLKNLELIVFDLDGTLLRDDNSIGKRTIEYVDALHKLGVKFSFASGRLHSAITDHASTLSIKTPLISLDGSLIKSYPGKEIIYESYVPLKYVEKALKLADEYVLKIALCHDDAIYFTEYNSTIPDMLDKFGALYEEVNSYNGLKKTTLEIVITGENRELIKQALKKFTFPHGFRLSTTFYKSHGKQEIYYLEIRKKGSNKGTGLKRLAKHLSISIKKCAVMGDWYNDRSLFETDALKIAVANAVPEIKRKADFITKHDNNNDAVADFLELVLNSKES